MLRSGCERWGDRVSKGCCSRQHLPTGQPLKSSLQCLSALQMVAVLLTGNGVAWLLFCSLWGSLPFR